VVAERVRAGVRYQEPVDLADLAPLPDFVLVEREREEEVCRWSTLRMFSEEVSSLCPSSPSSLRPAGRQCSGAPTLHRAAPATAAGGEGPAGAGRAATGAGGAAPPAPHHLPAEGHGAGGGGGPSPARPAEQGAAEAPAPPGDSHQVPRSPVHSVQPLGRGLDSFYSGARGRRATSTPARWRRPTGRWRGRRWWAGCRRRARCPSPGSGRGSTGSLTQPPARGTSSGPRRTIPSGRELVTSQTCCRGRDGGGGDAALPAAGARQGQGGLLVSPQLRSARAPLTRAQNQQVLPSANR
jgi:hypothetical protein